MAWTWDLEHLLYTLVLVALIIVVVRFIIGRIP